MAGKKRFVYAASNYPGTAFALRGCVNDALDMGVILENRGYDGHLLLDNAATKTAVVSAWSQALRDNKRGDRLVLGWSGHGTQKWDLTQDEGDRLDEAIVLPQNGSGGPSYDLMIDDELDELFKSNAGGRVTFISDSCYSGTLTRGPMGGRDTASRLAKWLPSFDAFPESRDLMDPALVEMLPVRGSGVGVQGSLQRVAKQHNAILLSGSAEDEVSWDATFNGRANGAFTYHLAQVLRAYPVISYKRLHAMALARTKAAGFDQNPTLDSKPWQRYVKSFA